MNLPVAALKEKEKINFQSIVSIAEFVIAVKENEEILRRVSVTSDTSGRGDYISEWDN